MSSSIHHSVCRWPYDDIPFEDFCIAVKSLGIGAIDLLETSDFAILRKHGLECPMVTFPTGKLKNGTVVGRIEKAFNRLEHHETLIEIYEAKIKECAAVGAKQLICFPGNREGMSDEQGLENCVTGISKLLPLAKKYGITLVMELLNSKVDHPDYMADHTEWGVALADRLQSEDFKLLYDIYHMQLMEGDIITTIRKRQEYFSHYHTGGAPGRNEIGKSQELNYPAIMQAILDTGYQGYVAQEFIPTNPDKIASLREAIEICSVGLSS